MMTFTKGKRRTTLQPLKNFNGIEIVILLIGVILFCLLIALHESQYYKHLVDTNNAYGIRLINSYIGIPIAIIAGSLALWSRRNKLPSPFVFLTFFGIAWFAIGVTYATFF